MSSGIFLTLRLLTKRGILLTIRLIRLLLLFISIPIGIVISFTIVPFWSTFLLPLWTQWISPVSNVFYYMLKQIYHIIRSLSSKISYMPVLGKAVHSWILDFNVMRMLLPQVTKGGDDKPPGQAPRGLNNLGNTCYFNSIMQPICHTPILQAELRKIRSSPGDAIESLREFYDEMLTGKQGSFSPSHLHKVFVAKVPRFGDRGQHDSHECLRSFLDRIRQEERETWQASSAGCTAKTLTAVERIFGGHLLSVYICAQCGSIYHLFEPCLDLSVPICLGERRPLVEEGSTKSDKGLITTAVNESMNRSVESDKNTEKCISDSGSKNEEKKHDDTESDPISTDSDLERNANERHDLEESEDGEEKEEKHGYATGDDERQPETRTQEKSAQSNNNIGQLSEEHKEETDSTKQPEGEIETREEVEYRSNSDDRVTEENEKEEEKSGKTPEKLRELIFDMNYQKNKEASRAQLETDCEIQEDKRIYDQSADGSIPLDLRKDLDAKRLDITEEPDRYKEVIDVLMRPLRPRSSRKTTESNEMRGKISIEECLWYFTRLENIPNEYLCNPCNNSHLENGGEGVLLTSATKQTLIFDPPAILTIHLKRFELKPEKSVKRSDMVTYGELLDIAPYCSSQCLRNYPPSQNIWYSLYAVVVHTGTLEFGHYVAYVKLREDEPDIKKFLQKEYFDRDVTIQQLMEMIQGKAKRHSIGKGGPWYLFNDSSCRKVSTAEVLQQEAYLLFYERLAPF